MKKMNDKEFRVYMITRKLKTFGGLLRRGKITKNVYDKFKENATNDRYEKYVFCISDNDFDDMTFNDLLKYYSEEHMIKYWNGIGPKTVNKLKNLTGVY